MTKINQQRLIMQQRDRRDNILNYFKQNNIKSIKLSNNKLIIKYNDKEEELKTTELQQIKDYIQQKPTNILTLKDLESKKDNSSNTNNSKPNDRTGLYIGCGVVGILLVLVIFIIARIRKRKLKK